MTARIEQPVSFRVLFEHPILSREEELELLARAREGDLRARDRLLACNMRFVGQQAERARGRLSYEDAVQEGALAFLHAIDKWRPEGGASLRSYAAWWVAARVKSAELRVPMVKVWTTQRLRSIRVAIYRLCAAESILPSDFFADSELVRQIATRYEITEAKILALYPGFLEASLTDEFPATTVRVEATAERQVLARQERQVMRKRLDQALQELPQREQVIVRDRHMIEEGESAVTLQVLGRRLGISRERVRQLELRGLQQLRQILGDGLLIEFGIAA